MKSTRVSLLLILGYLSTALIGVGGYAGAQTLVGTTTDPKGIDGLVIDGTTYNVTFTNSQTGHNGPTDYSLPSPFTYNTPASHDAVGQLSVALSSLGVTRLAGISPAENCDGSLMCEAGAFLIVSVNNALGSLTVPDGFVAGRNDVAICGSESGYEAGGYPPPCSQSHWGGADLFIGFGDSDYPITDPGPTGSGFVYFTKWTVAPEPGTFALLAAGLLGIGFARRKLTS